MTKNDDSESDRRGFRQCMAGTGAVWTTSGGVLKGMSFEQAGPGAMVTGTYEYYCSIHPKMTGRVVVA